MAALVQGLEGEHILSILHPDAAGGDVTELARASHPSCLGFGSPLLSSGQPAGPAEVASLTTRSVTWLPAGCCYCLHS